MTGNELAPGIEDCARKLAGEITARRKRLDYEDAGCGGHPTYMRAKKHRDQDRARINGMVIALACITGHPLDMPLAEGLIAGLSRTGESS